jgi:pimeloyl-ACP methyl ester carboxylesterase
MNPGRRSDDGRVTVRGTNGATTRTRRGLEVTNAERWTSGESRTVDLGGSVHYVDFGGPDDGPTVVLVHGLGGSHLNWDLFAPLLRPHARVLALDLPGFGRSEPGGRRTSVQENVKVLDRFLADVAGTPVVLVGNSMGGMISILETASAPEKVSGLVLLDAAVPGPRRALDPLVAIMFAVYSIPLLGERVMALRRKRSTPLRQVRDVLRLCGVDPDALPPEMIDRSVALIAAREDVPGMDKAFIAAARSLVLLLADPRRYRQAMASIRVPVLMVQGDKDRLVPVAAARDTARRNPTWQYLELAGVGHVPQLQVPEELAKDLVIWLEATAAVRSQA